MGHIFNRNKDYPGRKANWILEYIVEGKRIRESGGGANKRVAERLLDRRMKEIEAGTWKSPAVRSSEKMTVAALMRRYIDARKSDAETATSKRAVQNVHDQAMRLERYVLPLIGARPANAVTREEIKGVISALVREGRLAPRSIHHVYDAMRGMFAHGAAETPPPVDNNPCTLTVRNGELPKKRDKNVTWRKGAVFSHGELYSLFTDERVHPDRQMFFGLLFFGGMRFGEAAGRKWLDYDMSAEPLGRLGVYSQYDGAPLKGEGQAREVPVHPFLAWMLRRWREQGFPALMGRKPRQDDLIVPSRRWAVRSLQHMGHKFHESLAAIDLRKRSMHDLRASFITLSQDDGGDPNVLRTITHQGNKDVWTGYSRHQWAVLCSNVARMRFVPPEVAVSPSPSLPPRATSSDQDFSVIAASNWRGGRDLNPQTGLGLPRISDDDWEKAVLEYAESVGVSASTRRTGARGVAVDLHVDLLDAADAILSGRKLPSARRRRLAAAVTAAAVPFAGPQARGKAAS